MTLMPNTLALGTPPPLATSRGHLSAPGHLRQSGLQIRTHAKHSNTFCTPPLWASSCSGPPYTVCGDAGKHAGTGAYCALRTERRG